MELQQVKLGTQTYGVVFGPTGYIVTDNDFVHSVYKLTENAELRVNWKTGKYRFFTPRQLQVKAKPIDDLKNWAHYFGIKSRVCANYHLFLRSMTEIGANNASMPTWN